MTECDLRHARLLMRYRYQSITLALLLELRSFRFCCIEGFQEHHCVLLRIQYLFVVAVG